jgi:hypothetical protein
LKGAFARKRLASVLHAAAAGHSGWRNSIRELASDDGPIFATVAKLVEALRCRIPDGTENAVRKKEGAAPRESAARYHPRGGLIRGDQYQERASLLGYSAGQ